MPPASDDDAGLSISVVIPVFNAAGSLRTLVARLQSALTPLGLGYEVILVNDGSRDGSWDLIRDLAASDTCVRGINMSRNYGQHNALLCGVRAARGEVVVTMDDDLQNPPEEIPRLLARLNEGFDAVYGTPERERHGLWRDLASRVTKLALQNAMGAETAAKVSAFRAFRTRLREAFADYRSPYICLDVVLAWGTTAFSAVTVRHEDRQHGVSNYTLRKLIVHALNMMTGFSTLPLQVASLLGLALSLGGVAVMLYVLGRYFIEGGAVPGFPFLACIIALFSGAQLFALGIIGEYIARMHFRMMERPVYTVMSTTDARGGPASGCLPYEPTCPAHLSVSD